MYHQAFAILLQQRPGSCSVYKLFCTRCLQQCIGKTGCSLAFRLHEHAIRPEQPMCNNLANCTGFNNRLHGLRDCSSDLTPAHERTHLQCCLHELQDHWPQWHLVAINISWGLLYHAFKDKYYEGLKASRELKTFFSKQFVISSLADLPNDCWYN